MKYKIKQLSEKSFEVLGNHVMFTKSKGRTQLLCSCTNSSNFADNNFCFHKELVLEYIMRKPIIEHLNRLIKVYENWVNNDKLPANPNLMLEDLKNLKKYWRFVDGNK